MIIRLLIVFGTLIGFVRSQFCPNSCNGNGRCVDKQCECFHGYFGADCSLRECPKSLAWVDMAADTDNAHNLVECSNMGNCERVTGTCLCRVGFEGKACERLSCPNRCYSLGECESMYYYALNKDPGTGTVYKYENIWDAHKIYGCRCDKSYFGSDCGLRKCPTGDDPLTGTGSTGDPLQMNEVQKVFCTAGGGYFTLTFRGKTTTWIPYNAKSSQLQAALEALPTIGTGNIKIVMYNAQACTDAGTSWTVEFLQAFGDIPMLVPNSEKLTFTGGVASVILTVAEQTKGTKENENCSNRGICDTSLGTCTCSTYYETSDGYNSAGTRGDCGHATETIQFCPGQVSCSGHGQCLGNPTYRCQCSEGWTGADCSLRVCPSDVVWFGLPEADDTAHISTRAECSNKGTCDRNLGECVCDVGFSGASCDRLTCPGDSMECNGHGQCLDMATLATLSKVNGVTAGFTYGDTPNNPVTWDAKKIFGCVCDKGYEGYDCTLKSCPFGDDPETSNQVDEQQQVLCTLGSSSTEYLTFSFRDESVKVSATATTSSFQTSLESLSSIGYVTVESVGSAATDQLCTNVNSSFVVTFLSEHGDLPLMSVSSVYSSVNVTEVVKGDKEVIECSGRGLCDHLVGKCQCFSGYGPSDGMGGKGSIGDCGYLEPLAV